MPPENKVEQLERKVIEMEETISQLVNTARSENIDTVDDQLILNTSEVNTGNISRVYQGSISGNVTAPDYPEQWLIRRHKGKVYLVPAFELDKK